MANPYLRPGDRGRFVEELQRLLNLHHTPTPLAVDGIFGPATEARLREFQAGQKLQSTGIVDPRTWDALGPLDAKD